MTGGLRSILSGVFLAVATVAAVAAIWCVWAQRQLLDTPAFTARSVEVIQDPAVREVTAAFLADQFVDQRGELSAAASQLPGGLASAAQAALSIGQDEAERTALAALQSGRFDVLWAGATQTAHTQFVDWLGGDLATGDAVELELQPLLTQLARDVGVPDDVIAAGADVTDARVEIIEAGQYDQTRRYATSLERGTTLMAPLAIIAALLSILCARNRRWAVVRVGAGATLAGVVTALSAAWIGDQFIASMTTDGAAPAVAEAVWASLQPPLTQLAWIIAVGGAGLALLAVVVWPRGAAPRGEQPDGSSVRLSPREPRPPHARVG